MRVQSFAQLALTARQMVDAGGQQNGLVTSLGASNNNSGDNVTDQELLSYLQWGVNRVWDLLLARVPQNYGFRLATLPVNAGVSTYPLPADFKAVLGVNLLLDSTGTNFISILPFNENQRNMFSLIPSSGSYSYLPYTATRYQLQGNSINFIPNIGPGPAGLQIRYQPAAPVACLTMPGAYATATPFAQGALVSVTVSSINALPVSQVFMALNAGTSAGSAPTWLNAVPNDGLSGGTLNSNMTIQDGSTSTGILWAYQAPLSLYATGFDGINGFEEYVCGYAARRIGGKQERDCADLDALLSEELTRINSSATKRQNADPPTVTPGWGSQEQGGFGGVSGGSFGSGF